MVDPGDIGLFIIDDVFDLKLGDGDLEGDAGLETAVTISLFSDRRVKDEELPAPQTDKKGWWGDMFPVVEQDKIGSRLWLLNREKRLPETLRKAEDYSKEALNWLIEDGVASSINVTATYDDLKRLQLAILISKPSGRESRFQVLWDQQKIIRG